MENFLSFWLVASLIAVLVASMLALAMMRARRGDANQDRDIDVYRDQLAEVERDLAKGVIAPDEADRIRLEVSRRLLEADKSKSLKIASSKGSSAVFSGLVALSLLVATFGIYSWLGAANYPDLPLSERLAVADAAKNARPSQIEAEAALPALPPALVDPSHGELMEKLRAALIERPDDLQGHILLAQNEASLGNFAASHRAQERILEIKGDAATADDIVNYADMLILAAAGYISPQAEDALSRVLQMDPSNGVARYYSGLLFAQNDRADLAFQIWKPLYEESPPDAPWVEPIRERISIVAAQAGVSYEPPEISVQQPGPTAEDVEAAQDMSDEDRTAMIKGMVAQLSERLATEGGPPQDWARLISVYGVLGETERARAIWEESQGVFAGSEPALEMINAAALSAGLND